MAKNKALSVLIHLVILAGLCYGGWVLTGWLSVVCWVVAFFVFGSSIMAAESKPCPVCGAPAHASKGKIERCLKCEEHFIHVAGEYVHVHGAEVPDEFRWPNGCCVCGAPPTRTFQISAEKSAALKNLGKSALFLAAGAVTVHTGGGTTYSLDVPHCDEHSVGAFLKLSGSANPTLMFRSESYRDAFRELNAAAKEQAPPAPEPAAATADA